MDQRKPLSSPQQETAPPKSVIAMPVMAPKDYHFLRKALILLGASIALSAVLVGISRVALLKLRETGTQLQQQQDEVHSRYKQAETEKMEVRDFQPKFIQLRERGFVGKEKRLDWIEHIKHIHENRQLLPFVYEISAQQPFQVDPSVLPAELELRGSKISLHMELLHEMDLFNFLADLKNKTFYAPQACMIKRVAANPGAAANNILAPTLSADCTLYWLTIGEQVQNTGEAPKAAGE